MGGEVKKACDGNKEDVARIFKEIFQCIRGNRYEINNIGIVNIYTEALSEVKDIEGILEMFDYYLENNAENLAIPWNAMETITELCYEYGDKEKALKILSIFQRNEFRKNPWAEVRHRNYDEYSDEMKQYRTNVEADDKLKFLHSLQLLTQAGKTSLVMEEFLNLKKHERNLEQYKILIKDCVVRNDMR